MLVFIYLTLTVVLCGQATYDTVYWDFENIGVEDGLSAGLAYDLNVDAKGRLWSAGHQGLNRYDGYSIDQYVHDSNPFSLPSEKVSYFKIDRSNRIWVSFTLYGTYLYDPKVDGFRKVFDHCYHTIKEDCQGLNWVKRTDLSWEIIEVDSSTVPIQYKAISASSFFSGLPQTMRTGALAFTSKDGVWWMQRDSVHAYTLDYAGRSADKLAVHHVLPKTYHHEANDLSP